MKTGFYWVSLGSLGLFPGFYFSGQLIVFIIFLGSSRKNTIFFFSSPGVDSVFKFPLRASLAYGQNIQLSEIERPEPFAGLVTARVYTRGKRFRLPDFVKALDLQVNIIFGAV